MRLPLVLAAAALLFLPLQAADAAQFRMPLIWHVESDDGRVLDSREANRSVNPASVVKLVTSLRALEKLGTDHRFTTRFGTTKPGTREDSSLVVEGGMDPDFHFENAVVVARALEQAGVRRIPGDLYVGSNFWMGWERGTAGREPDPAKRRLDMGQRLVQALDAKRWSAEQKQHWAELAARRKWDASKPPSVVVEGRVRLEAAPPWHPVVEHRSEPLVVALRRFNVFSNNDIERLDASTGPASEMRSWLESRWGEDAHGIVFATSSGLNRNRMTPKQIVRLLRELRGWLAQHGHQPSDIMPVLGCGESTLYDLFPRLRDSGEVNGLAGKTGTLKLEDNGVSALAGFLPAGPGLVFFVAAPGSGADLPGARAVQEDWVRSVLRKDLAVRPPACPPPVPSSEEFAQVTSPATASAR